VVVLLLEQAARRSASETTQERTIDFIGPVAYQGCASGDK
jgi:hypothetical protein